LIIGAVLAFLIFLTPFILTILLIQIIAPSQQQASTMGLPPDLVSMYQEVGKQFNIPWNLLAAVYQLNHPALPTGRSASGQFEGAIQAAASQYRVDPALIEAVIQQESGWNPRAVSSAGARGLMQLMPENCRQNGLDPDTTCFNPYQNIMAGTRELAGYLQKYHNNLTLALAAFNAGPGNVDKYHGVPPFPETRKYVENVPSLYQEFKSGGAPINLNAVKQDVTTIAQNLSRLLNGIQSSACDQQLKNHPSMFGKLACALYAMKPDWSFVDQVEATALTYEPADSSPANPHLKSTNSNMKNTGGLFPWPCEGTITSGFGMRWGKMHKGVDIANSLGTPIYAVADGVVTVAKADPGGFGFYIVIDHGNGISTLYGHIYPETVKVKVGQHVKKGQLIAAIGSNGHSTGPHLHFEVHINDSPVDPMQYLMKR
jgi:murein DD-endopeptidase MepM/ murein hydrolase activator NlpD